MNKEQLLACLWLRWRLSRNQFARAGRFNAALSVFFVALMALLAATMAVGGVLLGLFVFNKMEPPLLLGVWDGVVFFFLVFWFSGLMVEIQRSESIDITKLLHLPVSLRQVFVFNFIVSHFTPSVMLWLPFAFGLVAGLALSKGFLFLIMFPVVAAFLFMITSWTYCLRGWLTALMTNKRRRRAIIMWVTIGFVLTAQLPNIFFNSGLFKKSIASGRGKNSGSLETVIRAHMYIPPGWVAYSAMSLAKGSAWPATGGTAAAVLIGFLGLMRAYRMTLNFYTSSGKERAATVSEPRRPASNLRPLLVEREILWVPDDTAALALATFRSLLRAPELRMALIMPIVASAILLSMNSRRSMSAPPQVFVEFVAVGAALVAALSFGAIMSNAFGLDRNGFRALVLLPLRRHHVLLAKNLAYLPFVATVAILLILLAKIFTHMPWMTFAAGVVQVFIVYILFSLICNVISILVPYRFSPGTLQAKKPRAVVFLAMFATLLLPPLIVAPAVIPSGLQLLFTHLGWLPWLPVNLLSSFPVLFLSCLLYWTILPAEGRLLQKREQNILKEVTEDIE